MSSSAIQSRTGGRVATESKALNRRPEKVSNPMAAERQPVRPSPREPRTRQARPLHCGKRASLGGEGRGRGAVCRPLPPMWSVTRCPLALAHRHRAGGLWDRGPWQPWGAGAGGGTPPWNGGRVGPGGLGRPRAIQIVAHHWTTADVLHPPEPQHCRTRPLEAIPSVSGHC